MLTSEEKTLLQRPVAIDGNVVGNDNTVQVKKVDAETYVTEINDRRIAFTVQDLRQIHVQQSQVVGLGDNWHVEGGIHYNIGQQTASSDAPKHPHGYHNLPQPDYGGLSVRQFMLNYTLIFNKRARLAHLSEKGENHETPSTVQLLIRDHLVVCYW
jgi:hypothetical protein